MFDLTSCSRRDDRYPRPAGESRIAFDHPDEGDRCLAEITLIGIAGLGFVLRPPTRVIAPGTVLSGVSLQIGDHRLRGDVVVRNSNTEDDDGTLAGGLFYPEDHESERELAEIIGGLASHTPDEAPVVLHVRCGNCQGTVPVARASDCAAPTFMSCPTCGQPYAPIRPVDKDETHALSFSRARKLAMDKGIDVPSAYSVLHGVLSLSQVQALQEAPSTPHSGQRGETRGARALRYDPAFREAVEAGCLTPRQAFERGKRCTASARVAREHGLPMKLALDIVDNRISLLAAIRESRAGRKARDRPASSASAPRARFSTRSVAALVGIVAVSLLCLFLGDSKDEYTRTSGGDVKIQTDPTGQIVRIEGPDPVSVLDAFCESSDSGRDLRSVGFMDAGGTQPGLKLGLLEDGSAADGALAIYISRNRSTRRWIAGNGRSPLVAFQAPDDTRGNPE